MSARFQQRPIAGHLYLVSLDLRGDQQRPGAEDKADVLFTQFVSLAKANGLSIDYSKITLANSLRCIEQPDCRLLFGHDGECSDTYPNGETWHSTTPKEQ